MNFSCGMVKFEVIYVQKWKIENPKTVWVAVSVANRDLDRGGFAKMVASVTDKWKETFSGDFCNICLDTRGGNDLNLHNTDTSYLLGVGLFHLGKLAEDKSSGE